MQRYIARKLEKNLKESLNAFPVIGLLGPRQCGKSTLAKEIIKVLPETTYLDLEKQADLRKIEDPEFFFSAQKAELICIDEIQRVPGLFPAIRVAVDEEDRPGRFLLLGSASQDLIRRSSETLAGRIHYEELTPFVVSEVEKEIKDDTERKMRLWQRGGYPRSFLAGSEHISLQWREDFIRTFLERDIPQFGFSIPSIMMRRLWTMLAHYHGGVLNLSKLGQSLGVSHPTVRKYIDILEQTFMVRMLPPLEVNVKKRLVKSPKVYIRDSGILHALLEIEDRENLLGHPVVGASWEGWCIEQICTMLSGWRASFYRTSSGEEIDLILERGRKRLAFEFKSSMSPKLSRGFPATIELLKPDKTWVVAPVNDSYGIQEHVMVCSPAMVLKELAVFR